MICMLDGAVRQGRAEPFMKGAPPVAGDTNMNTRSQLFFESVDGEEPRLIAADRVKVVYVGSSSKADLRVGVRFFDSAPLPTSLWVKIAFADGEVLEGMIANTWSAFSSTMLEMYSPGHSSESNRVLIPRGSVAELQVIATR